MQRQESERQRKRCRGGKRGGLWRNAYRDVCSTKRATNCECCESQSECHVFWWPPRVGGTECHSRGALRCCLTSPTGTWPLR